MLSSKVRQRTTVKTTKKNQLLVLTICTIKKMITTFKHTTFLTVTSQQSSKIPQTSHSLSKTSQKHPLYTKRQTCLNPNLQRTSPIFIQTMTNERNSHFITPFLIKSHCICPKRVSVKTYIILPSSFNIPFNLHINIHHLQQSKLHYPHSNHS